MEGGFFGFEGGEEGVWVRVRIWVRGGGHCVVAPILVAMNYLLGWERGGYGLCSGV